MPASAVTSKREDAVLFKGDETLDKARKLLETYGVPKGLLMPLKNVEDWGSDKATGEIWLKQKAKVKHHFKRADSFVSYATQISFQLEKNSMKNIKGVEMRIMGVKTNDNPFYFPVSDIFVNEKTTPPQIYFKSYDNRVEYFPAEYFKNKD